MPQGFIEVPVTDAVGRPRTSVACGAGIRVDGEVAQTAVVYGAATEDCENWLPLADTDQETEVKSLVRARAQLFLALPFLQLLLFLF